MKLSWRLWRIGKKVGIIFFDNFMAITKKQIEHLAFLARLKFSEKEKERFQKDLSQILDYLAKLDRLETKGIEPFFQKEVKNIFRADKIKKEKNIEKIILKEVPEKEGSFVKTRKIF